MTLERIFECHDEWNLAKLIKLSGVVFYSDKNEDEWKDEIESDGDPESDDDQESKSESKLESDEKDSYAISKDKDQEKYIETIDTNLSLQTPSMDEEQ